MELKGNVRVPELVVDSVRIHSMELKGEELWE